MSGSTTRLGLYLAGGGSSEAFVDEVIDIDRQNGNFEDIDEVIGYLICTSATRPATPFNGMPIYETDTKNRMLRVSGAWVPVGVPNAASSVLRDSLYPAPASGDRVYRTDLLTTEVYNGTAWRRADKGMVLIKPTSVDGTGVSVDSAGKITFTAATAISINGCFTDEFDNYRIIMDIPTVSAAANFSMRLRAAGTDNSDALYDSQRLTLSGATVTGNSSTASSWVNLGVGNRLRHSMTMDILGPKLAQYTSARGTIFSIDTGINPAIMEHGLWHRSSLQFDGISVLSAGAQTLTGTEAIYGYND